MSPSPDESLVPSQSVTPSPPPTPPANGTDALPHDSIAQVVTTDLVIRSEPGVHDGSEIYPARLNEPMLLYVVDGPARASGFDWYLVQPFENRVCSDVCPERLPFGWVAQAGQDGEVWVAPGTLSCPAPSVADVQWVASIARLACFGDTEVQLRGEMGPCYSSGGERAMPKLLVEGCTLYVDNYEPPRDTFGDPGIRLRYDQFADGPVTPWTELEGERVRVSGQFDHPTAAECGSDPHAVLLCRAEFVVSAVRRRD